MISQQERDRRLNQLTLYQLQVIVRKVHDALFLRPEGGMMVIDTDKEWTHSFTLECVNAAFAGTDIGYQELGGK